MYVFWWEGHSSIHNNQSKHKILIMAHKLQFFAIQSVIYQTTSMSITWELVQNVNSRLPKSESSF